MGGTTSRCVHSISTFTTVERIDAFHSLTLISPAQCPLLLASLIRRNIPETQQLPSATTAESVPWLAGTGSTCRIPDCYLPTHQGAHSIRLYTTRTLKPLGTLKYHKTGCQAVEFARALPDAAIAEGDGDGNDDSGDEDEMSTDDKAAHARWLAVGGKDHRVSIWSLMSFERT